MLLRPGHWTNADYWRDGQPQVHHRGVPSSTAAAKPCSLSQNSTMTHDKINDLVAAKDAILQAVVTDTKIERPQQLVTSLFTQPSTKVKQLTDERLDVENTARKHLNQLVDMGILPKKVISGHHYYLNLELHRILSRIAIDLPRNTAVRTVLRLVYVAQWWEPHGTPVGRPLSKRAGSRMTSTPTGEPLWDNGHWSR